MPVVVMGPRFHPHSFFKLIMIFSGIGHPTFENWTFSFEIVGHAGLHASPSDGGHALRSDFRQCRAVARRGQ